MAEDKSKKRLKRLFQWRETDEYQHNCNRLKSECEQLISMGQDFLELYLTQRHSFSTIATNMEYARDGDIHRGVYCPSPVLDLVVGNLHRGNLIKRSPQKSKASHCYGFDENHRLKYIELLQDGNLSATEYIIDKENRRYGFTINLNCKLAAVSEEIFEQGKIMRYKYAVLWPDDNGYFCSNLHVEDFFYDELGLCASEKIEYQPYVNIFDRYRYEYERTDGFLSKFSFIDYAHIGFEYLFPDPVKYTVRAKRKA